jgi:hypothetical protein
MNKKLLLGVVILVSLALTGSTLALAPMGPPTAGLKTGQFRAGVDYSYSEQDIQADWDTLYPTEVWPDVRSNLIAANIGYGIADNWEVFGRLGVADASFDEYTNDSGTYDWDVSGNYGFLFGFGTKVTFLQQENLDWGALFQMHWLNSKNTWKNSTEKETLEINAYEIQIAVGPTWKVAEGLSIYGGPFLQFIGGEADFSSNTEEDGLLKDSPSLKQESELGGYVGAQWDFMQNTSLFSEFQLTGDAWGFGTGIGWKF